MNCFVMHIDTYEAADEWLMTIDFELVGAIAAFVSFDVWRKRYFHFQKIDCLKLSTHHLLEHVEVDEDVRLMSIVTIY